MKEKINLALIILAPFLKFHEIFFHSDLRLNAIASVAIPVERILAPLRMPIAQRAENGNWDQRKTPRMNAISQSNNTHVQFFIALICNAKMNFKIPSAIKIVARIIVNTATLSIGRTNKIIPATAQIMLENKARSKPDHL